MEIRARSHLRERPTVIGASGPRGRAERSYSVRPFLALYASHVSWVVKDINESRLWKCLGGAHDFC